VSVKTVKSGGYNLEDCKASQELTKSIVSLIAIAHICAGIGGMYHDRGK